MHKLIKNSRLWGPVLAAALTSSAAYANHDPFDGLILHEDLNDYSEVNSSAPNGISGENGTGYSFNILLDEAYVDYQTEDVIAYQRDQQAREHAEFAAFETSNQPSIVLPWELNVVD